MSRHKKAGVKFLLALATLVAAALLTQGVGRADSVWSASSTRSASLYSTTQGEYKIGDIITILIIESFSAENTTSTDTDKETELDAGFDGFDDIFGLTHIFGRPLSRRKIQIAQQVGFFVILAILVLVMWRDLARVFSRG